MVCCSSSFVFETNLSISEEVCGRLPTGCSGEMLELASEDETLDDNESIVLDRIVV